MADPQRSSLTIQGGPLAGRSFLLPDGVGRGTIGSDPTCNILVPLPGVGARHVLLDCRAAGTFVVDQGSARGVFISDTRIAGEKELRDGDVLWLGPPGGADSVAFKCRLAASRPMAASVPAPPAEDFFVSDTAGSAESAPPSPVGDDALFVSGPSAGASPPSAELSDAFFVGPDSGGAEPAAVQAEVPSAAFFVQDSAPTAPATGPDDFFVADAAEAPPAVALHATPSEAVKPAAALGAQPRPGLPAGTAPAPASTDLGLARGTAPQEKAVSARPPAATATPVARPAVRARGPVAPRPVNGRAANAIGVPRQRSSGPAHGPGASGSAHASRPRRSGGGSPAWLWPLVLVVGLVAAGAAAYALLMLVGRPRVSSVDPQQARVGDTVVLTGEGFGASAAETVVSFDDKPAQIVVSNAHRIEVKVPDLNLAPGERRDVQMQVRVGRKRSTSAIVQVRKVPRIDGLSPDVAATGEELLLAGGGWATSGVQVLFDGMAGEVRDVAPAYLRVRVPPLASPQGTTVQVVVASGPDRSDPVSLVLGRLPVATSVEPRSASMGDVVTVRGRGLRGSPGEHTALIGGTPALVVAAADGRIELMVPAQAPVGEQPLELHVRGYANPALATLTISPATDPITLRFVAEPSSEAGRVRAAVGTALGPAFVLAYAGGRSAGERAAEAVRRLNGAVAALRDQRDVMLELRLGPTNAAIGIVGSREPLLEVTNEDAQAYTVVPARGRTATLTRGRLANWWLAELRDIVLLLRGERPRSTEAYGADARFITDVYDAAMRAGGPVTHAVVGGLRPAVRDGLRAMALRVPATVPEPGT